MRPVIRQTFVRGTSHNAVGEPRRERLSRERLPAGYSAAERLTVSARFRHTNAAPQPSGSSPPTKPGSYHWEGGRPEKSRHTPPLTRGTKLEDRTKTTPAARLSQIYICLLTTGYCTWLLSVANGQPPLHTGSDGASTPQYTLRRTSRVLGRGGRQLPHSGS